MGTRDETLTLTSSNIARLARGVTAWEPEIVLAPGSTIADLRLASARRVQTRLSLAVRTVVHHARCLLDRLAAALGYSRSEHAAFERWLNTHGGGFSDEVLRRPAVVREA